ncbi:MAG: hypothetical protein KDD45_01600 [Bdellovibrionales bacterium]|nr:hypothetical protein [Bdellovibrionales bacterium]
MTEQVAETVLEKVADKADKALIPGAGEMLKAHIEGPVAAYHGDDIGAVRSATTGYGALSGGVIGGAFGGPPGALLGAAIGTGAAQVVT